ncbi:hypothetical protein B0H13DRAFT_1640791 [Mycena leptocephala]|nr:hypothetical protein B0H13DRAFT_1640791 [Mycena leptocephala]
MSGPGPRTTWEELANLGWSRQAAYNALNALRGRTVECHQDKDILFPGANID